MFILSSLLCSLLVSGSSNCGLVLSRFVLLVNLTSSLLNSFGSNSALSTGLVVLPNHLSVGSLSGGLGLSSSDGDFPCLSLGHLLLLLHLESLRFSISLLFSDDIGDSLGFFELLLHTDVLWVKGSSLDNGGDLRFSLLEILVDKLQVLS